MGKEPDIIDLLEMHKLLLFDPRPKSVIETAIKEITRLRIKENWLSGLEKDRDRLLEKVVEQEKEIYQLKKKL